MNENTYKFNNHDYYPPMIVVQKSFYSWGRNITWEVVLPVKQYGVAQNVRLGFKSHMNDYNGGLNHSIKRALRAKQMVKAYQNIPVYIQVPHTDEFIELDEDTAIQFILLYGDGG
jgi:hypothetical protein